jgi:hypothetical protein
VESVGETITIDENNLFDNNEFGIGDYEPGQTFVSLIKELPKITWSLEIQSVST